MNVCVYVVARALMCVYVRACVGGLRVFMCACARMCVLCACGCAVVRVYLRARVLMHVPLASII